MLLAVDENNAAAAVLRTSAARLSLDLAKILLCAAYFIIRK